MAGFDNIHKRLSELDNQIDYQRLFELQSQYIAEQQNTTAENLFDIAKEQATAADNLINIEAAERDLGTVLAEQLFTPQQQSPQASEVPSQAPEASAHSPQPEAKKGCGKGNYL